MKKYPSIILLAVLLVIVAGCRDKAAMAELEKFKAQTALEEQNKALVIRYMEAWQKGDIKTLKEIFSPDYVLHSGGGRIGSLNDMLENIKNNLATFSDFVYIGEDIIAKGDKVIIRYVTKGTNTGEIFGVPATGKKIEIIGMGIKRIENGKIVEDWDVSNNLSLVVQLGFEMKPKVEKKK